MSNDRPRRTNKRRNSTHTLSRPPGGVIRRITFVRHVFSSVRGKNDGRLGPPTRGPRASRRVRHYARLFAVSRTVHGRHSPGERRRVRRGRRSELPSVKRKRYGFYPVVLRRIGLSIWLGIRRHSSVQFRIKRYIFRKSKY